MKKEKAFPKSGTTMPWNVWMQPSPFWTAAITRAQQIVSYYAVFHAMRAVLALNEIDMRHHSGIISEFRKRYIKTGVFETRLSQIISVLFDTRTESDYDDFFVISKAEVVEQTENAEYFLQVIKAYLDRQ